MEDVQALEAVFAASDSAEDAEPTGWLTAAVQGMILLNISAALFGSNQVLPPSPYLSHMSAQFV